MTNFDLIALLIYLLVFGIVAQKLILFIIFELRFKQVPAINADELPTVSVLIPARNEAENLPNCLESLLNLDYPLDKLEIWIGNDQSTDATTEIANDYAQGYEHIHMMHIQPEQNGLVARSNVLAQLAESSANDLLVFLDADMEVDPLWLAQMVAPTGHGYDLVSGYTRVAGKSWLAHFQNYDWNNVIALLKAGADADLPGTALGNNMLVSRKAYVAVGGYEAIGPTYTEDNDLTLAITGNGLKLFQLFAPQAAQTLPMKNWVELRKQRTRWMLGAFKQPLIRLIPLIVARIFMLFAIAGAAFDPAAIVIIPCMITLADVLFSLMITRRVKNNVPFHIAIFAPVFNSVLDTFTLLSYPWNRQVVWKGRKL